MVLVILWSSSLMGARTLVVRKATTVRITGFERLLRKRILVVSVWKTWEASLSSGGEDSSASKRDDVTATPKCFSRTESKMFVT